jgi:hypothetical protein
MARRCLFSIVVTVLIGVTANAQGTHQFLGPPQEVPVQISPKYRIKYNTQGYDQPQANWAKKMRVWRENDLPEDIIAEILASGRPRRSANGSTRRSRRRSRCFRAAAECWRNGRRRSEQRDCGSR